MLRRPLITLTATTVCLLAGASSAAAAERWASPTSTTTDTVCASINPCTLAHAVSGATAADAVIVTPGTYAVGASLDLPAGASMRGQDGQPRPTLVGDANLALATLSIDGSVVKHLRVEATRALADAMTLKRGATVQDVILVSAGGDGAKVVGHTSTTTLRDSVVLTKSSDSSSAALKLRDGSGAQAGPVAITNVTAWATGTTGVKCETATGQSTLTNTIVRGTTYDVDASGAGIQCSATYSNVRTANSPGLSASVVQDATPLFHDLAAFDFRPAAGSPTIDQGTTTGTSGAVDPAGNPRTTGANPDIGAFEYVAIAAPPVTPVTPVETTTGTTTGDTTGGSARTTDTTNGATPAGPAATTTSPPADPATPAAPPQLGKSVVLDAGAGTVKVKLPGTDAWVALDDVANLPTGTAVNALNGEVTLSTALPSGKVQTGTFGGGVFEVRQGKGSGGMTDILLRGGSFAACAPAAKRRAVVARAAMAGRRGKRSSSRRPIRRLWASDKGGRFRTHGRDSVATVRGTRWLTEDHCDGTLTRVLEGAVDVRDVHRGTVTRVRAGRSVLVRHAGRR